MVKFIEDDFSRQYIMSKDYSWTVHSRYIWKKRNRSGGNNNDIRLEFIHKFRSKLTAKPYFHS